MGKHQTDRDRIATGTSTRARSAALQPRKSGRPPQPTAERLRDHILDVATDLFLKHGYGLTSIEAIARHAKISKRTFYHRFTDKAELFREVVQRIILRLHPPADVSLIGQGSLRDNLQQLAQLMLQGALSPQGLALSRLIIGESGRFPELAEIALQQGGRQEAITLVSGLIKHHAHTENIPMKQPAFAAEQFLQMVITLPQRRAMGLGAPMTTEEIKDWVQDTVDLFLHGCFGRSYSMES